MAYDLMGPVLKNVKKNARNQDQGPVSQNLSSVTNDIFCYKLVKSLLLIGYQQICH